ncbi:MAG: hypothetical protein ACTSUG_00105 [Candidatus Helarchaeota archaeon]
MRSILETRESSKFTWKITGIIKMNLIFLIAWKSSIKEEKSF